MDRHRPAEQGAGTLTTGDGTDLAAEWSVPDDAAAAAVLTHPHPLMGGDMRTPVPDTLFRALPGRGIAVLRFDFRGGGRSSGTHDGGEAEALDVRAAVDRLRELAPGVPLWVVGYSFGADVALQVVDRAIAGWVLVAPPLRSVPVERMAAADDPRPKLVLVPAHDQFCDPSVAQVSTEGWAATTIEVVPGADHFLAGRTSVVADLVVAGPQAGRTGIPAAAMTALASATVCSPKWKIDAASTASAWPCGDALDQVLRACPPRRWRSPAR